LKTKQSIFIDKDLSPEIKNFLEGSFIKSGMFISTSVSQADISISRHNPQLGKYSLVIRESKIEFYDTAGNVFYTLDVTDEMTDIELAIIKTISIINGRKPFDLYASKARYVNKLSKFLQGLVVTLEVEDERTNMSHSQRVALYSVEFSRYLGLDEDEQHKIKELCMLHDIGRIGLEQLMLFSPTRISEFESWDLEHTITGSIFLSSLDELWFAVPVVRSHHENWNGSGYPDGLKENEIPFYARLVGIIDWFDIATHTASSEFDGIMSVEDAIISIDKNSGKLFDPVLGPKFVLFMKQYLQTNTFL
jgi:HD-GYP domain-containing protein (c-di-GMP phosphodiesterase class II)